MLGSVVGRVLCPLASSHWMGPRCSRDQTPTQVLRGRVWPWERTHTHTLEKQELKQRETKKERGRQREKDSEKIQSIRKTVKDRDGESQRQRKRRIQQIKNFTTIQQVCKNDLPCGLSFISLSDS